MPPTLGKRIFSQAMPEPALEPIQSTAIVVIHPGSQYLRVGRASDPYPQVIPHCVARLHKKPGQQARYEDKWMVRPECMHPEAKLQMKAGLKLAEEAIRYKPMSNGEYRQPTNYKQLFHINSEVKAERSDVGHHKKWTDMLLKPEFLIGEEGLYVSPRECYNLHWPMRQGRLNLHSAIGGTLSAVIQDLETIWTTAIRKYLDIPIRDLKHYRAVLLIPDIYNRQHVKEMINMLLTRMGFSAAFVHQESVCATFGTGVASACVLDIGDQKTSVSCVEDGISQKPTRLCMEFGGSDIVRCLHWLLTKAGFPYKECNLADKLDARFVQEIKENNCHMDQDTTGVQELHLQLQLPTKPIVKYTMQVGDELCLAPMSMFYPDMFGLQGTLNCRVNEKSRGDAEDPHDEDYLLATQSRQEQAARLVAARKREQAATENVEAGADESNLSLTQMDDDEDTNEQPDTLGAETSQASGTPSRQVKKAEEETIACVIMGVDQAILQSIDKCDNDDMKKRMYSTIIVVGGGMALFRGASTWIKYAVWTQMPAQFRLALETMDVITEPKDMDPRVACWKGGSILSCLDTAQELWIRRREWERFGVRMLRERAPFIW